MRDCSEDVISPNKVEPPSTRDVAPDPIHQDKLMTCGRHRHKYCPATNMAMNTTSGHQRTANSSTLVGVTLNLASITTIIQKEIQPAPTRGKNEPSSSTKPVSTMAATCTTAANRRLRRYADGMLNFTVRLMMPKNIVRPLRA